MRANILSPDPKLDLVMERVVQVSSKLVWAAWTQPEHLKKWFTPAPWTTVTCGIDLRPGGAFRTVMRSPEGQDFPNDGCYLEILEGERLVWTNAMVEGFRPRSQPGINPCNEFEFTAVVSLEARGDSTKYTAHVIHATEEGRKNHEAMGFHDGWGKALDQLVAAMKK